MRSSASSPVDTTVTAAPNPPPRRNNTKSCQRCRDKRVRCDGRMPSEEHPEGSVCSACTAASLDCVWDKKPDKRLAVSRHDHEQLNIRIKFQDRQIAELQERLRANGLPDDLPEDIEENDNNGYGSDADDELAHGFERLVLEEDNIMYYGDSSPFADLGAPMLMKPRLPAIEGFQHSTSRMYEIQPMHALGGPGRDSNSTKWDMFLPRGEDGLGLITRDQHDRALELYFRFFTSWTLRVIPHFFLRDLAIETEAPDPKPQNNHYSPMLHNIILATALAFSDDTALRERPLRDEFISKGKSTLDFECQRPTLSTVQSLDLLSSYYSGMGDQTLGFMYFGMAIRMGQALGLHVRIPDGKIANDDRIERNWVYWNVFIHDKTWSLYVGRNQGLPTTQVEMRDPPIDFRMDSESWYWRAPDGRVINQQAYLSSTFAEVVKLSRVSSHIMAAVYDEHLATRLRWKLVQINEIWLNLRKWRQLLRKELVIDNPVNAMQPAHIFQLNIMHVWMILLLLRPFYEPHLQKLAVSANDGVAAERSLMKDNEDLKKIYRLANEECPKAAGRMLDLFQAYDKLFTLRLSPLTNVQIAYLAGKTLMRTVSAGGYGGTKATQAGLKAREKVRECAKLLRAIGETWPSGIVTAGVLEKDLDAEIEKQNMSFVRSPNNNTFPIPPTSNSRITASPPAAIPIVSSRFVVPKDDLGAADTVGTSSGSVDSVPESPKKRRRTIPSDDTKRPLRNGGSQRQLLSQASYAHMPVLPVTEQNFSVMPTMNSNFDFLDTDHSPILLTAPSASSQVYYAPPPYPPPPSRPLQHTSMSNRVSAIIDPLTGVEMPTSMGQWLAPGGTFSGAPSSETPYLPYPVVLPSNGGPDTEDTDRDPQ